MWGQSWGEMVWGQAAVVPLLSPLGLAILVSCFLAGGWFFRRRSGSRGAIWGLGVLLLGLPLVSLAGSVSLPNTFSNGTVADAVEVNENFDALAAGVNDNDARLDSLESSAASCPAGQFVVGFDGAGGLLCSGELNGEEGASCGSASCAAALYCAASASLCQDGSTGDLCNQESDCDEIDDDCAGAPSTCQDRLEGSACSTASECPGALYCANQLCQDGSLGDFCNQARDCIEGTCTGGVCQ